ncbi:MAG: dihydropteroate synthase [Thermodesulfobacteriota bacterium]
MRLIADNIHGLNPVVAEAMVELDPKPVQELALQCVKNGADIIDLNPGHLSRRREDRMEFLVDAVQEVTSVRLMLDSPNPRLLERGLSACVQTPILDAVSLEAIKIAEILPLAVTYGAELVALLMDRDSRTPPGVDEKLAIAIEIRELAIEAGLGTDKIIYDPVLPSLSWHDPFFQLGEVIKGVRLLTSGAIFGEPAKTMTGISNLRSGMRSHVPDSIDTVALSLLAGAGLDFALADALQPTIVETCRSVRQIL